jgi:predicted component of type VI protein secretion system
VWAGWQRGSSVRIAPDIGGRTAAGSVVAVAVCGVLFGSGCSSANDPPSEPRTIGKPLTGRAKSNTAWAE